VSNILPLTIESLVAILLLLTILYCVRLNSQLKRLKADESSMKTTIAELVMATETAERAIAGLNATMREAEHTLGERLVAAERFSAELVYNTEAGTSVLDRLTQIAGANIASNNAAAAEPKRSTPDPKAIVAAAQAFAERTRPRPRGRAA